MHIGIYGGTFDPPHNGHISVVGCILSNFKLDKLYVVPTWKTDYKKSTDFQTRFFMCALAFEDTNVILSGVMYDDKMMYTYQLIRHVKKTYGNCKISLFIGDDWDVSKFKNFDYINKNCSIVEVRRGAAKSLSEEVSHINDMKSKCRQWCMVVPDINIPQISSTLIRSTIREGGSVYGACPNKVINFIKERGLYRGKK